MKAIIVSVLSALVAVVGFAAPANAIGISGAHSTAMASNGWVKMGIGPNGAYIMGESTLCYSSAGVFNTNFHEAKPVAQNVVQQTPSQSCTTQTTTPDPVVNPPANSTVTINGVCGDPAEIAKIKATNANLIINSVGPCLTDGTKPATPVTVIVKEKETVVKTAGAKTGTTTTPAAGNGTVTLPETGLSDIALLTTGLGALAYAGTLAIRAFRARA